MKTTLPFQRSGEDLPQGHKRLSSVFGLRRIEQDASALTSAERGANFSKRIIGALVDSTRYFGRRDPAHPYPGLLP